MPAINHSRQRDAIRRSLAGRKDHPTAEAVYRTVRGELPHISLGTVYRDLSQLAEDGEIARLRPGDGLDHFDPDPAPHPHFLCTRCGSVSDLDIPAASALEDFRGTIQDGRRIDGHSVTFYGLCRRCLSSEKEREE